MHGPITRAEKKQRQHSEFSLEAEKLNVLQKPCLPGGTRHQGRGLRSRGRVARKERELHRLLWFAGLRLGIGAGTEEARIQNMAKEIPGPSIGHWLDENQISFRQLLEALPVGA